MKRFFKLLVTSATYRQSAASTPEKIEKDPQNRLLSRGPRFRMDAEMIRDYALAASNLLVDKVGGPSVKPYQPEGVWEAVAMPESNTRNYRRDQGEGLYRRSLYTFWKRGARRPRWRSSMPPAARSARSAASGPTRRSRPWSRSTIPSSSRPPAAWPSSPWQRRERLTRSRIDFMASRLLARPLRPEEIQVVQTSVDRLIAFYQSHPEDAAKLLAVGELKPLPAQEPAIVAAWTMLANELMNLDEVLNK